MTAIGIGLSPVLGGKAAAGIAAPANLALSITGASKDVITATWDAVSGAATYEIEYSDDGATYAAVDTTALLTYGVTSADYDIDAGQHYVRVRAVGGAEWALSDIEGYEVGAVEAFPLDQASGNETGAISGTVAVDNQTVGSNTGKTAPLAREFIRANNEYFTIASPPAIFNFAGDFTIAGWAYAIDTAGGVVLNRLDASGGGSVRGYALGFGSGGKIQWWCGDSHGNDFNAITYSAATWYQMLLEYTASTKTTACSVNNANFQTTVSGVDVVHANGMFWGTFYDQNFNSSSRMNGWWFWNRRLSAAQRTRFYNGGDGVPTSGYLIVTEGDSLTGGYDIDPADSYPAQLMDSLIGDYALTDVSEPGEKIGEMEADIASTLALYDAGKTNILCFWAGTNDLHDSIAVATVEANYQDYCEQAQAAGFSVVAFTILPRSNTGTPVGFEAARQTFNTWLRTNYTTFADALADVAANTDIGENGDSDNLTYYLADKVHMTAAGYAIVAGIVQTAIEGL